MSVHQGNIAELSLMLRAKRAGFNVLTPYSKDSKYDCVLEKNGKFFKVQCKSTSTVQHYKNGSEYYKIICSNGNTGKKLYKKSEVDYFAFYIMPLDIFYVVPFNLVKTKTVKLKPNSNDCRFKNYVEAFNIIK